MDWIEPLGTSLISTNTGGEFLAAESSSNGINGSTVKQQKSVFDCPACEVNPQNGNIKCVHIKVDSAKTCEELVRRLHTSLHAVVMENISLQAENEALRRSISSKCEALDIILSTVDITSSEHQRGFELFQASACLKKDISRLQTELALANGTINANKLAYEARIQEMSTRHADLIQQLEATQTRMKQLVDENLNLLCRITTSQTNSANEITSPPPSCPLPPTIHSPLIFDFASKKYSLTMDILLNSFDTKSSASPSDSISDPVTPTAFPESACHSPDSSHRLKCNGTRLSPTSTTVFSPDQQQTTDADRKMDSTPLNMSSFSEPARFTASNCKHFTGAESLYNCCSSSARLQNKLLCCSQQLFKEIRNVNDLKITLAAYQIALENQFKRHREQSRQLSVLLSYLPEKLSSGTPSCNPPTKSSQKPSDKTKLTKQNTEPSSNEIRENLLNCLCQKLKQLLLTLRESPDCPMPARKSLDGNSFLSVSRRKCFRPQNVRSTKLKIAHRRFSSADELFTSQTSSSPVSSSGYFESSEIGTQTRLSKSLIDLRERGSGSDVYIPKNPPAQFTPYRNSLSDRYKRKRTNFRLAKNVTDSHAAWTRAHSVDVLAESTVVNRLLPEDTFPNKRLSYTELLNDLLEKLNELDGLLVNRDLTSKLMNSRRATK
ncbi:hypothetical protein P879_07157 [Paragonimus westermani]|uniref:Uncharacterized protein n=1 Tax=Paragonimus westermani TaxID=34504 RepID=A0A8T0D7N3_9TREM|nr:hypothetical protein P879_07157 [Paragonimus westermani]